MHGLHTDIYSIDFSFSGSSSNCFKSNLRQRFRLDSGLGVRHAAERKDDHEVFYPTTGPPGERKNLEQAVRCEDHEQGLPQEETGKNHSLRMCQISILLG